MPRIRDFRQDELAALVAGQAGVVSRSQALSQGMSPDQIRVRVATGTWSATPAEGVYLTFTGAVTDLALCWIALLYAGQDAVLCRASAAWAWNLNDTLLAPIHVMVPPSRRVLCKTDLVSVHYSVHHASRRHPVRSPPVTKLDDTVLDMVDFASQPGEVIDVVTRSCQRRLTAPCRLSSAAAARKKLGWRALLVDVLTEVTDGVQSPLERVYCRDVERAHGLPRGQRNVAEGGAGGRRYRDVRYRKHLLVVELDGSAAHPIEARDRDAIRDNELVEIEGTATLRYGWTAVTMRPCDTAAQVARLLHRGGWTEPARPCGPDCPVGAASNR